MTGTTGRRGAALAGSLLAAATLCLFLIRAAPLVGGPASWSAATPAQVFGHLFEGASSADSIRDQACSSFSRFITPQSKDESAQLYRAILFGESERLAPHEGCH